MGSCTSNAGDAGVDTGPPLDCTPDLHVAPASSYAVPSSGEVYVCYGLDVTVPAKRQVIAFSPRIDARAVVHHVSLLQADAAVSPTPTPCPPLGAEGTWKSLYGWTPGVTNFEMPPEAGFPLEGTTHYVVQVHYANTAGLTGQMDASGFDLCTTDVLRPNDADIMAFGTTTFSIPANGSLDITCDVPVPVYGVTTHLIAALPHMHQLGRTISTHAYPGGVGAPVDLGTVADWDFNRQSWLHIADVLAPGDVVSTRCAWDNPTAAAVASASSPRTRCVTRSPCTIRGSSTRAGAGSSPPSTRPAPRPPERTPLGSPGPPLRSPRPPLGSSRPPRSDPPDALAP